MKPKYWLLISLFSVILASFTLVMAEEETHGDDEKPHWTYAGEAGPEHWGSLSEDYAVCGSGMAQSPINLLIADFIEADLTNIQFNYGTTKLNANNTGHSIQVDVDAGSSISYNGIVYALKQFHFHTPSEHTIEGEHATMEVHFVHEDPLTKNLAVVGIFMLMDEGDDKPAYADVFANMLPEAGKATVDGITLDLNALLPEDTTYLTYQGSLTTPPCSQIVRWLLLGGGVRVSQAQLEAFQAIYAMNARPTQDQHDRDLLVDITE